MPDHAVTLPHILQRAVERYGDRIALDDKGRSWTFAELQAQGLLVTRAAMAAGIEKGDRIAIWCPNIAEWVIAAVGMQCAGAVLVPLANRLHGPEAADILARAGVKMLFTYPRLEQGGVLDMLADKDLPALQRTVLLQGEDPRAQSWQDFLASGEGVGCRGRAATGGVHRPG